MATFKNFKDKLIDKFFVRGEEYDEDEEVSTQAEAAQSEEPFYDSDYTPPIYNDYSYSPTGGLNPPEYEYSRGTSSAGAAAEFSFAKPPKTERAAEFKYTPPAPEKKSANIYSMSSARPANKFRLNSITLEDIYAAKEVALHMMEKDTILIVNFSSLEESQKIRAMDFLDGARCVTNAIFARLNENIIVFVPENVELRGDFQSQVDLGV